MRTMVQLQLHAAAATAAAVAAAAAAAAAKLRVTLQCLNNASCLEWVAWVHLEIIIGKSLP